MNAFSRLMLGLAIATLCNGAALAQAFVMKFGTASLDNPETIFMKSYKNEVERRSGGKVKVELYFQSQLGALNREIEGVQLGTIEAVIAPVDYLVGIDARFGVFSTPLLFRDRAHAQATMDDPELQKALFALAEPKGMIGVATVTIGVANYAGRTPLLRLADFRGKKLRINGTALERAKMSRMGATGVPMALSEVAPALSQGIIDGTISTMSTFVSFKMNDLVNTVTVTNDSMINSIVVVSRSWLTRLPPELRTVVMTSGEVIRPEVERQIGEFTKKQSEEWVKLGGQVHMLPQEDLDAMKSLLGDVGDEVTKGQPAVREMLSTVRAAAAKY